MAELCTAMEQTAEVRKLLDAVDRVFTGTICISWATVTDMAFTGDRPTVSIAGDFWNWAGSNAHLAAGIEWWPGFVALARETDTRLSEIAERFTSLYRQFLMQFAAEYPACAVRFAELGTFNYDGASAAGAIDYDSAYITGNLVAGSPRFDNQEFADSWGGYLLGVQCLGLEAAAWAMWVYSEPTWPTPAQSMIDYTPVEKIIGAVLE
jgi:hypothetical protein